MIPTTSPHDEPLARPGMLLAMALAVVSIVGWRLMVAPTLDSMPLVGLGTIYVALGTAGWVWCERRGGRAMVALLVALTAVTLATLWVTRLDAFLLVMPLLCLVVLYTTRSWAIALIALLAVFAAGVAYDDGSTPLQIYSRSTGFLPGAAFAVVFSELILRERRGRREARRYAAQAEELAVTSERNRIAREIHDSVGHYLTVVHVQIEAARAVAATDAARAAECLTRAQELAREGLSELRRSVAMLRSGPAGSRPFGVALSGLVDECESGGLRATLTVDGEPRALAPAIEFALYRVAQEALTNVKRHACAEQARCTLRYDDGEVRLRIEDDGVGAAEVSDGFGLIGLRERIHALGGSVDVRTAAGQGFAVEVRVPR